MRFPRWYLYVGFVNAALLALLFSILSLGIGRSELLLADRIFAILYTLLVLWGLSLIIDSAQSRAVRAGIGVFAILFVLLCVLSDRFMVLLVPSVFFSEGPGRTPGPWSTAFVLFLISCLLVGSRFLAMSGTGNAQFRNSSRFAVSIFLTLALIPAFSSNEMLKEQWYRLLMGIRGEHAPSSDEIVLLAMSSHDRTNAAERKAILGMIAAARPRILGIIGPGLERQELRDLVSSLPVKVIHTDWGKGTMDMGSPEGFPSSQRGESYLSIGRRMDPTTLALYYVPVSHGRIDFGLKVAAHALAGGGVVEPASVKNDVIHAAGRMIPLTDDGRSLLNYHRVFEVRRGFKYDMVPFEMWVYGDYGEGPFLSGGREGHYASFKVNVKEREFLQQTFIDEKTEVVGKRRAADMEMFRNKIIIVDIPLSIDRYLSEGLKYATVIQNILDDDFTRESGPGTHAPTGFILALIFVLAFTRWTSFKAIGFLGIALVLLTGSSVMLFVHWSYLVQPGLLVGAWVGALLLFFPVATIVERNQLAKERARLDSELRSAREMQIGLLPKEDPVLDGFEVAGMCVPAHEVGGDFFDYVWLDDKKHKLGIAVADVSGKAMKAAITAVMTSGMIYQEVSSDESPKKILRNVNRPLYLRIDHRMFTAAVFTVLDTRRRELRFSNAGQVHPLLKRGSTVTTLEVRGARLPLGVKEDVQYEEMKVKLRSGDAVILSTDGVADAMNEKGEFFGFDRFRDLVGRTVESSAKHMVDVLSSEVMAFTGEAPQHDDLTIVVIRVL